MNIRVEVENEILGNSVFWEGPTESVREIRNVPARLLARLVSCDGQPRASGMWRVTVVPDAALAEEERS